MDISAMGGPLYSCSRLQINTHCGGFGHEVSLAGEIADQML